jgi:hypothetical protein
MWTALTGQWSSWPSTNGASRQHATSSSRPSQHWQHHGKATSTWHGTHEWTSRLWRPSSSTRRFPGATCGAIQRDTHQHASAHGSPFTELRWMGVGEAGEPVHLALGLAGWCQKSHQSKADMRLQ